MITASGWDKYGLESKKQVTLMAKFYRVFLVGIFERNFIHSAGIFLLYK